jgi:FMN reductase
MPGERAERPGAPRESAVRSAEPTARPSALRLLAVVGSVTPPGRLRRAVAEAVERAQPLVADAALLDLGELLLSFADGREPGAFADDTGALVDAVAEADVVVLATPVYLGSMTGALKNVLDQLPIAALHGKVVGLVAMGGSDHHFLGADRHLRDVLSFFGVLVVPVSVYLTGADFADGAPGTRAATVLDALIAHAIELGVAWRPGVERTNGHPAGAAGAVSVTRATSR